MVVVDVGCGWLVVVGVVVVIVAVTDFVVVVVVVVVYVVVVFSVTVVVFPFGQMILPGRSMLRRLGMLMLSIVYNWFFSKCPLHSLGRSFLSKS